MNLVVIAQRTDSVAFGILHIDVEVTVTEMVVGEAFSVQRNNGDVLMPAIGQIQSAVAFLLQFLGHLLLGLFSVLLAIVLVEDVQDMGHSSLKQDSTIVVMLDLGNDFFALHGCNLLSMVDGVLCVSPSVCAAPCVSVLSLDCLTAALLVTVPAALSSGEWR